MRSFRGLIFFDILKTLVRRYGPSWKPATSTRRWRCLGSIISGGTAITVVVELLRYSERRLILIINAPECDVILGSGMAHPLRLVSKLGCLGSRCNRKRLRICFLVLPQQVINPSQSSFMIGALSKLIVILTIRSCLSKSSNVRIKWVWAYAAVIVALPLQSPGGLNLIGSTGSKPSTR